MAARLRSYLHSPVAAMLHYSGSLAARRFFRTKVLRKDQICVLGFHRVLSPAELAASNSQPGIIMKESTFASLLEYLTRHFHVVGVQQVLGGSRDGSRPCCAITFDDGWKDNYTRAYPWLRKYRVPATIFLVTGLIGGDGAFWVEKVVSAWRDPERRGKIQSSVGRMVANDESMPGVDSVIEHLKRMSGTRREELLAPLLLDGAGLRSSDSVDRMLTWEEVAEMSAGGIEFGAHTVTHPLLTYEDGVSAERELRQAKLKVEEKLSRRVRAFAYPNGDWNPATRQRVARAGYDYAFTTREAWYSPGQDLYTIPRVLLHDGNVTGHDGRFSPAMFNLTLARSG
jgi:peptidoglycan/xylan/chitin deacetylase (PgdA/CDA1 family)